MKVKDRLQGYFLAGAIGFAIGVLWMIYSIYVIYVEAIYESLLIFTIIISITILGIHEVHEAIRHQGE